KRSRETIPADCRRRVGTPLVSVSPRRAARETRRPTGDRGEKPPRGVGSEPGDRQDGQRISGKVSRKSMPVLSVPGGDHAVRPTAAFRRPCPSLFFGPFALTALHQLTWRIRAGTVARLHTSHHANAPESCHVPDRGSGANAPS